MTVELRAVTTVVLPGTGSDDHYVRRAFGAALRRCGAAVVAVAPQPRALIAGYRAALDDAAAHGPIAVAGVSIGAAVAVAWALANPGRAVAVIAALPAWSGPPEHAPAAAAARLSAQVLRRDGLTAATQQMRSGSPRWLGEELTRSWAGQWPDLPAAMDDAARYVAPTAGELATLTAPMGVVAAVDDTVHPLPIGAAWAAAAPRAALRTVTLDELGADPAVLGTAGLAALTEALSRR